MASKDGEPFRIKVEGKWTGGRTCLGKACDGRTCGSGARDGAQPRLRVRWRGPRDLGPHGQGA